MIFYNRNSIINYDLFIKIIFLIFTIDIFLRIINYDFTSIVEALLITLLLCVIIFNKLSVGNRNIYKNSAIYVFFISYLLVNISFSYLFRTFFYNANPINLIVATFDEFRFSEIDFFIFLIFFYVKNVNAIEKFIIQLLKIGTLYTIFEQILSLFGFRDFFQKFYFHAGVVTPNLINLKELGLYRIWGLVGSTELLGVYNVILFVFLIFDNKKAKYSSFIWILLSFCSVIFSTSKTAWVILFFMLFIWIIYKNKFFIYTSSLSLLLISILLIWFNRNNFILINFFEGSLFYFQVLITRYNINGIINHNLLHNLNLSLIAHIIFGRGPTFSFIIKNLLPYANNLYKYKHISVINHFFLSFIDQFGLFGYFLFSYLFFIKPLLSIHNKDLLKYNAVLIILFLAFFHYPVLPSKLIVLYISYAVFKVYFSKSQIKYGK